jgi:CO/xanthine dehydrogenase FAD-binding subunit
MIEVVEVPTSAADAVAALGSESTAVLAGGTLLMPKISNTATGITRLVSTRRIDNVGIDVHDNRVTIGAAATLASLETTDALLFLRPALEVIGSPTIRNMATVAGNLFAEAPYGDLATCLMALRADIEVLGPDGARTATAESVIRDGVANGELVTNVSFDLPADSGWFFTKAMRRKLNSASIVTIAANLGINDHTVETASVALGACGSTARRSPAAEIALIGGSLDETTVDAAAQAAIGDAEFLTDEYASAWYRERVFPVHFRRAMLGHTATPARSTEPKP